MKPLIALLAALCLLASAQAAEEPSQPAAAIPVEVYQPPKGIDLQEPQYPPSQRAAGSDGWVIVNMMVDPEGKPYEATVVDSTGNAVLEKAALAAVEKWRFEPATLNGKPIHAGGSYKINFVLTGESGASETFALTYRKLVKAVQKGERERADSLLAQLKPRNLYEDAYAGLANYTYAHKWGSVEQQLSAVRRAIAGENSARYLPKGAFISAQQAALALELQTHDFGQALRTWAALRDDLDPTLRAQYQKTMDQIETLRTSDEAFAVSGEITKGTSWYHLLLKNRFQIEVANGAVAEIKLRCSRQYVSFHFDPQLQYTVKGGDRGCWMEVVGDPGTKFQLVQL